MTTPAKKTPKRVPKKEQRSIENPAVPLTSPLAYDYLIGRRSTAGVAVNRETVLGYPAVWRAVNLISDKVGRLPLHVYRRNKDGGREEDTNHPASWLLTRKPSNLYTPFVFRKSMMANALLSGNSYAWIIRDSIGRPDELIMLDSERTFPVMAGGKLWYVVKIGNTGQERKLLPENVLHIRGLCHDGLSAISVVDVLREAFGLGIAAQRYGSTFFRNNGSPGPTIIKMPTYLKDKEQLERFRAQWSQIHEGLDNSHRVAILENGADIVQNTLDMESSQFLQTREFEVKQIANIFGVPPHKLGADISTSYGSLEQENLSFLTDGLDGWLVQWEQECGSKLLKTSEMIRDSHFCEFNRLALESGDVATQTTAAINRLNNGLTTQNEERALLNRASAGPDGDRFRMPSTVLFADVQPAPDDDVSDTQPDANETEVEPSEDVKEPVETNPSSGYTDAPDVLRSLLASVVKRYLQRVHKAAEAASKREDWQAWLEQGLETHRSVLADSIAPVAADADGVAQKLLGALREELREVTRDQVSAVFGRLDVEDWTRRILDNEDQGGIPGRQDSRRRGEEAAEAAKGLGRTDR